MSPTPGPLYLTIEDAKDLMPFLTKLQSNRLKTYIENNLPIINPQMQGYYLYNFILSLLHPDIFHTHRLIKHPIL